MRQALFSLFIVVLSSTTGLTMEANELGAFCKTSKQQLRLPGITYVVAIADAELIEYSNRLSDGPFCIPYSVSREGMFETVCIFIESKPDLKNSLAAYVVRQAFKKKYPCREPNIKSG